MQNPTLRSLTANQPQENQNQLALILAARALLDNWHWYALSVLLCLAFAVAFLRYKTPEYRINASILVKDDVKGSDLGDPIVLQGLGLSMGKSNVDNEVEVLKSRTLAESVIKDLQLYVQYFSKGDIKTTEILEKNPFRLKFIHASPDSLKHDFETYHCSFSQNGGWVITGPGTSREVKFGDTLIFPAGRAILYKTANRMVPENSYSFRINRIDPTVKKYRHALTVSVTNKQVSMINLTVTDVLPERGEAILNQHIANYIKSSINDKNRIADSTIAFIDQNLMTVSADLRLVEKHIEAFRKTHHQAAPEESGSILLQNASDARKLGLDNEVQLKVVETLEDYMSKNPGSIIPASLMIQETGFTGLIARYNDLQISRGTALLGNTAEHPHVKNLDEQLETLNADIKNGIEAQKATLKVQIAEMNRRGSDFESQIDLMPAKQRMYLDYSRQQQIKQELYIFLLKKRVETSLSKSSTLANGRIIDLAKADSVPYKPSTQLTFLLAILIGFGIPAAIFYARGLIDDRISSKTELMRLTSAPLLAEIGHVNLLSYTGEATTPDFITEQFRVLRTNLQHFTAQQEKVILVTSSMGGEGKSFAAINLSQSLALMDLKVILVEFDLRKPKIADYLDIKKRGITEYLLSKGDIESFIQKSKKMPGFDVLTCGVVPPNPAELILFPKAGELISFLKSTYDYVVIDTPPAGIVADAQLLSRYAQITLYIVRQGVTHREQIDQIQELYKQQKLPRLHIVLNDVKAVSGYGYGYHPEKS